MQTERWARQAWKVWDILAKRKKTMTYMELGSGIGETPRNVKHALAPIMWFCYDNKLPALTSLVVRADTGEPGEGLIALIGSFEEEQNKVFAKKDWSKAKPKTPETFIDFMGRTEP